MLWYVLILIGAAVVITWLTLHDQPFGPDCERNRKIRRGE